MVEHLAQLHPDRLLSQASLIYVGARASALGAALNTALFFAGKAAGAGFMALIGGPAAPLQALGPANVIALSMIGALGAALVVRARKDYGRQALLPHNAVYALLGAGLVLALLGRLTRRAYTTFLAIAGVVLLASLLPDWTLPMDSTATRALLSVMHAVAAAAIVARWPAPKRSSEA